VRDLRRTEETAFWRVVDLVLAADDRTIKVSGSQHDRPSQMALQRHDWMVAWPASVDALRKLCRLGLLNVVTIHRSGWYGSNVSANSPAGATTTEITLTDAGLAYAEGRDRRSGLPSQRAM
jgi:hypothetical protein